MRMQTRYLSAAPVVSVPAATRLTDEEFDAGTSGDAIAVATSTATSVTGAGTFTYSDEWSLTGGLSGKIAGTVAHYVIFTLDSAGVLIANHADHYASIYMKYTQKPGSDVAIYELRSGSDVGAAAQVGFTSTGKLFVRDGNSGTGAGYAETAALTLGVEFYVEASYHAGVQTVVQKSLTGATLATLTCTLAATAYSYERAGLMTAIAGGTASTGNLDVEDFDTSTTAAVTNTNRGTADAVSGSGALAISTAQFITGAKSLRIGTTVTAYHMYRFDATSHTDDYYKFYIRRAASPATDMYILQTYAGDNTTIAAQLGIDSTGKLFVRDSNSGTKQIALAALTVSTWFKVLVRLDGAGGITAAYYSSAVSYTTLVQTFAAATTLTATNFGKCNLGLVAASTGTPDIYIDSFERDSAAYPGGTAAAPIGVYLERIISDTAAMPAPLTITATAGFSEILVPNSGLLQGGTFAAAGVNGSTSTLGLSQHAAVVPTAPQVISLYFSGTWNGTLTSAQIAMFANGAIPFIHMKFNAGGATWQQVAAGSANAQIDQVATNLAAQFGRKFFFTLHHEPEDDVGGAGSGLTAANYVSMWQLVIPRMRSLLGGPAVDGGKMVTVLQYVGYSSWAVDSAGAGFNALDAGESYVDWYGTDPYLYNKNSRDTLAELLAENVGGPVGWTSMYTYLVNRHPTKPIMLCETGINIGKVATYPSLVNPGFTDAAAAAVIADWQVSLSDFPMVKALVYWSSQTVNGVYQPYSPDAGALFKAAYAAFAADSQFTQDLTTRP